MALLLGTPGPATAAPAPIVALGTRAGHELWVKREDLLDSHGYGFKVRKVAAVFAHARALGTTDVLLDGSGDSACCAAAAERGHDFGLNVHILVRGARPARPARRLQETLRAATSVTFLGAGADAEAAKARAAERLSAAGARPLVLPTGLTTPESLDAGIEAGSEIAAFEALTGVTFDAIFAPVGTGGTILSLHVAKRRLGRPWRVVGVCVDDDEPASYRPRFAALCDQADLSPFDGGPELVWPAGHRGYRVPSARASREAERAVREHGLLLDPTYMAKAWTGALDWLAAHPGVRRGLILVTGGTP